MKKNTLVDLFAGCGGLSLGLEQAGFHPIYVNELNDNALKSYLENRKISHPHLLESESYSNDIKTIINDGIIQMDFTLKQKTENTTRDHGYLFKLWPENFDLLFPDTKIYSLS